jgi:hypothetical protein
MLVTSQNNGITPCSGWYVRNTGIGILSKQTFNKKGSLMTRKICAALLLFLSSMSCMAATYEVTQMRAAQGKLPELIETAKKWQSSLARKAVITTPWQIRLDKLRKTLGLDIQTPLFTARNVRPYLLGMTLPGFIMLSGSKLVLI